MSGAVSDRRDTKPTMESGRDLHKPFADYNRVLIDEVVERYVETPNWASDRAAGMMVSTFGSALG